MQLEPVPPPSSGRALIGSADVPAAPVVKPDELWLDIPNLLVDGGRYSIGWQRWPEKDGGGPSFVTVRRSTLGMLKIVERYPLTDQGWRKAWLAFTKLDSAMAEKARSALAHRAEADSGFAERKELDARSLAFLPEVIFIGGYLADGRLVAGQKYDLRFLQDRLSVSRRSSLKAAAEFSYSDVQEVEVAGPGPVRKWSPEQRAMLAIAFGVTGVLVGYGSTRIKTFVRIQIADGELFFLHTTLLPEDLRIHLSRGIGAVRKAQAAANGSENKERQPGSVSLVDELSRLAGLLDSGLLTRDEFDQLKARLLAER
jgi:putative oligomerization/nucleic acid binding protein